MRITKIKKIDSIPVMLFTFFFLLAILFLTSGCGNGKLEQEIQTLRSENQKLKHTIAQLEIEIRKLKETDQDYFNSGVDAYNKARSNKSKEDFQSAVDIFTQLVQKFPQSSYLSKAKQYINSSQREIVKIEKTEKAKRNIEVAITEHNFEEATVELQKSKDLFTQDEYKTISKRLDEEKNKPFEINLRDLQAEPLKYVGKRVKVGPLKVLYNRVGRASFRTFSSTGSGLDDYDVDVSIEIFYNKTDNPYVWRHLSSDGNPVVYVIGIFKVYSNDWSKGYIQAEKIWLGR